jgi:Flp pilus assembly protein TadG
MRPERRRSTRHRDSGTVAVGAAIGAHDRGAEAVEFALVVPIFLLLVFGIVDFGYMINRDTMVNNASREGARAGALNPDQTAINTLVRQSLSTLEPVGTSPSKVTVLATCRTPSGSPTCNMSNHTTDAISGGTVIVTITYTHKWITPVGASISKLNGWPINTITLSKKTEMRIE